MADRMAENAGRRPGAVPLQERPRRRRPALDDRRHEPPDSREPPARRRERDRVDERRRPPGRAALRPPEDAGGSRGGRVLQARLGARRACSRLRPLAPGRGQHRRRRCPYRRPAGHRPLGRGLCPPSVRGIQAARCGRCRYALVGSPRNRPPSAGGRREEPTRSSPSSTTPTGRPATWNGSRPSATRGRSTRKPRRPKRLQRAFWRADDTRVRRPRQAPGHRTTERRHNSPWKKSRKAESI